MLETAIPSRQKADELFLLEAGVIAPSDGVTSDIRRVQGYAALSILVVGSKSTQLVIEEAVTPDGPWVVTHTLASALDATTGLYVICERVTPCGAFARFTVENLDVADESETDALVLGLAASSSGSGSGPTPPVDQVVPASFVVASTREDYPLTQAGLVDAIAALPAGGGEIWVGPGTLAISSPITIDKHLKLIGAGVSTIFSVGAGVTAFIVNAIQLEMVDFAVAGDDSAGSTFLKIAGTSTDHEIVLDHIVVGPVEFATTSVETIFNMDGYSRPFRISNCILVAGGGSPDPTAIRDGSAGQIIIANSTLEGAIPDFGAFFIGTSSRIGFVGTVQIAASSTFAGCSISGTVLRFNSSCRISGGSASAATLEASDDGAFIGVTIPSTLVAIGDRLRVEGCLITAFSSVTAGLDGHILKGNTFTGGGNNVTLTDSDGCVVEGNTACQVNETGTSDGNRYDNNQGFLGSTIIGPTSIVNGGNPVMLFPFAGTLDLGSNALIQFASLPNAAMIRRLRATVKTAPTGQAIIVDFKKVTLSTGVVGASIGTVTIAVGAFQGTANVLSPAVSLAITEGLAMEVTQIGSGVAGANLSGFADLFA